MTPTASFADARTTDPTIDLADQVYLQINALLSERIWTGSETLSDALLAQRLGVSRTPVRLALARLASEGLIRKLPGKGWAPIPVTLKDIEDIFDIKEALEPVAMRAAARNHTAAQADKLREYLEGMNQAAAENDLRLWLTADRAFHQLMFAMSTNARLAECIDRIDGQWFRFRMGYLSQEHDLARLYGQHLAIAQAIINRDDAAAGSAMLDHLQYVRGRIRRLTRDVLMPFLGLPGEPNGGGFA